MKRLIGLTTLLLAVALGCGSDDAKDAAEAATAAGEDAMAAADEMLQEAGSAAEDAADVAAGAAEDAADVAAGAAEESMDSAESAADALGAEAAAAACHSLAAAGTWDEALEVCKKAHEMMPDDLELEHAYQQAQAAAVE